MLEKDFLKYWGAGKHERKKSVLKFVLEQQVEIEMWDIVGELERSESKSTDRAPRAQYISKNTMTSYYKGRFPTKSSVALFKNHNPHTTHRICAEQGYL